MNDEFLLEFFTKPYKIGYESKFNRDGIITIRFRNSGSRYDPFNVIFMRMFHSPQEIDDVNSLYHQIHICEYLYNNVVKKKLEIKITIIETENQLWFFYTYIIKCAIIKLR